MAEKKVATTSGKKIEKRSVAQLGAMGNKGLIVLMVQRAFGLSRRNKFVGSELKTYSEKSVNGVQYALTKKNGKILNLDESSDDYKKVLAAAKSAKADLEADKLSGSVNNFINEVVGLKGAHGGGGIRTGAILKGFSFK